MRNKYHRNRAIYRARVENPELTLEEIGTMFGVKHKQRVWEIIQAEKKRDLRQGGVYGKDS